MARARVSSGFFLLSVGLCAAGGMLGLAFPEEMRKATSAVTAGAYAHLDGVLNALVLLFLVGVVSLAVSPLGRLRLGRPGEDPEFSTGSWIAMLFSAGLAAGILTFGIAEPIGHFGSSLAPADAPRAARTAITLTIYHWGLHAWSIYCVAGLVMAYFVFRHGGSYLASTPLQHAFGGRWVVPLAHLSNLLAVLAVAFGLAASVAIGSKQFATGVGLTFDVSTDATTVSVALLWCIVGAYVLSAGTKLERGIKWLSNANMVLIGAIVVAMLALGPTESIFGALAAAPFDYVRHLPALALRTHPFTADPEWFRTWTAPYFVWWVSWAPFVGVFVARISRGRTIRQFVLGVVCAPTAMCLVAFTILGSAGFWAEGLAVDPAVKAALADESRAIFLVFDRMEYRPLLQGATVASIFVFIVTSGDSASFVLGMLSSRGSVEPSAWRKVAWGLGLGLLSTVFFVAGNVEVILAMALSGALPFVAVLLLQLAAFGRALYRDTRQRDSRTCGHLEQRRRARGALRAPGRSAKPPPAT